MQAANHDANAVSEQEGLHRTLRKSVYMLLLAAFVLSGSVIMASDALFPSGAGVALEAGDVSPYDILAPRSLKYDSEVLLQAKRDAEVAAVRPIYDPPDASVKSEQLQRARQILDFIENVRYDDFATPAQAEADIDAITDLDLPAPAISVLLSIEDNDRWRDIDAQVMRLLERVLSGEVRDDNIQAKRGDLPNLISASYSEAEVQIITGIVADLMRVNTYFNEELTRQAQLQVAESVPVEVRSFAQGQMIIRAGELATAAHIEALEQFGLLQPTRRRIERFAGALLLTTLVAVVLGVYLWKFYLKVFFNPSLIVVLGVAFLLFLGSVSIMNGEDRVLLYFFPASALSLLVATLVGHQFAIVISVFFAAMAGLVTGGSLEFTVLIGLAGTVGVLSLDRTERLNAYFMAGLAVAACGIGTALLFALRGEGAPDPVTVLSQMVGSFVNGLLSAAVGLAALYVTSNTLNIPTSLKLVELMQPNHPLLQRLLREAPGTYQHSLQVANLAELGAQRVNANAPLVRVAAMYHDVGKILNPHFFVENQVDGVNPHDALDDPLQSARIIIGHVSEGLRLGRQYRLPSRLREFITEHHGTTQTLYFYRKAQERAGDADAVDARDFTYPGPRPQTREAAILMLADGCESSVRARRPQSKEDIEETVNYIFDERLECGQLDESELTLNDLHALRETFLTALQGVFHPRIAYPGTPSQKALPAEVAAPAATPEPAAPASSDAPAPGAGQDARDKREAKDEGRRRPASGNSAPPPRKASTTAARKGATKDGGNGETGD
ncbi:MAG: HDIG domain-containing protein [Anaerolineae bacterium]|nr:HDIG domain-containing protein [Anaerolineae bacterium]